jgi:hypothetical protein
VSNEIAKKVLPAPAPWRHLAADYIRGERLVEGGSVVFRKELAGLVT